jgi:hypothetical protein
LMVSIRKQVIRYVTCPDKGLRKVQIDKKGQEVETLIGYHLKAIARLDSTEGTDSVVKLEFKTLRGIVRTWIVPHKRLFGSGRYLRSFLLSRGYHYEYDQQNELIHYLRSLGEEIEPAEIDKLSLDRDLEVSRVDRSHLN